jgi:hypothetical protein
MCAWATACGRQLRGITRHSHSAVSRSVVAQWQSNFASAVRRSLLRIRASIEPHPADPRALRSPLRRTWRGVRDSPSDVHIQRNDTQSQWHSERSKTSLCVGMRAPMPAPIPTPMPRPSAPRRRSRNRSALSSASVMATSASPAPARPPQSAPRIALLP